MAASRSRAFDDRSFRVLFAGGSVAVKSDADLVRLFLEGHGEASEAAFSALIARHGPMVLGLCLRISRDRHLAEDAFQAVFLILARKARSVRVDDSLGPWLHGVARRVAVRARGRSTREVPATSERRGPPEDPALDSVRAEIRALIALEVARLPRKYREAVALHHLDGLSHDEAAEALGLPVGTVRSRLSRARDLLRVRLVRRGLAPAPLAAWLGARPASASVPTALLEMTLKHAGGVAPATIPPTVLALVHQTLRSFSMAKAMAAGALVAALGCLTTGAIVLARGGDGPPQVATPATKAPDPQKEPAPAQPAKLEDQFRRIVAEFEAAKDHTSEVMATGKTDYERWKLYSQAAPDDAAFARRMVDLAASHPKELASRDALIWVMNKPYRADMAAYGDEFSRAVNLLVEHHANDPEVARLGLMLDNVLTRRRDAFVEGIYAGAEGREAKGLARMALAIYLERKAAGVTGAREASGGRSYVRSHTYDDQGKLVEKSTPNRNEDEGYRVYARLLDADFVRKESIRLYEEVAADYADIPFITVHYREMERQARETPSASITDPEKKQRMVETEQYLARTRIPTLGEVVARRLDNLRNLSVGKVAPDFEGIGVDGKPIKLADYRGQAVAMVYWFSTCGPCLGAIPQERELAETMKGRPFTLLGIVTDGRGEDARKVIEAEKMTWPNVLIGGDKVAAQYHISGQPSYYVLDAQGVIRAKGYMLPSDLARLAEELTSEAEAKAKPPAKP